MISFYILHEASQKPPYEGGSFELIASIYERGAQYVKGTLINNFSILNEALPEKKRKKLDVAKAHESWCWDAVPCRTRGQPNSFQEVQRRNSITLRDSESMITKQKIKWFLSLSLIFVLQNVKSQKACEVEISRTCDP